MELLNLSIEVNTIKYIFHRTTADGNCMFNACSLALIGDESLASCLRPLTSIELYLNAEYYSTHPYIEEVVKKGLILIRRIFFANFCLFKLWIQVLLVIQSLQSIKKLKTMLPATPFLPSCVCWHYLLLQGSQLNPIFL